MEGGLVPAADDTQLDDESEMPREFSLLTDGIDGETPDDLLEHRAIARALAAAIRGTTTEQPLGIALFGAWGQGKTTIGRLLQADFDVEISEGKVVFVRVDAWKYAYEDTRLPLRRHFLLQAYESAGLEDEALELREGYRLERTRRQVNPRFWARAKAWSDRVFRWTRRRVVAVTAVVGAIVFFGGLGYLVTPFEWFIALLAGGLVLALLPIVSQGLYVTTREDPAWSIEVFEEHLQWLLDETQNKVERFVFLIDDLDRCRDEIVIEAIATLQAFFGKGRCVYVVAADEKQLKRAVRSVAQSPVDPRIDGSPVPADETFLEKIFQVSADVPRPSVPIIRRYATRVAESTRLRELEQTERASILSYLVHARVASPRQARVIINEFLLLWALAEEREAEDGANLSEGELSGQKLLLAKVVVLRSHFPWFYELLFDRPDLLTAWQRYEISRRDEAEHPGDEMLALVGGAASRAAAEMNGFAGDDELPSTRTTAPKVKAGDLEAALRTYLSLTRRTLPKDANQVQEVLYLRSREEFAGLTGAAGDSYRVGIANGDEEAIARAYDADASQAVAATRAATSLVAEPNLVQSDAARRAVVALAGLMSDSELRSVEDAVVSALYFDEGLALDELGADDPRSHLRLVARMPARVLESYAGIAPLDERLHVTGLSDAIAERVPTALQTVIARGLGAGRAELLVDALSGVRPELCGLLIRPAVDGVRARLEAPVRIIDEEAVAVVSAEPNLLVVQRDDESLNVRATGLPTVEAGIQAHITAHSDYRGELVLDALEVEGETIVEGDAPERFSDEERHDAWRVIEILLARALEASRADLADGVSRLAAVDWQREGDALRCVELVELILESDARTDVGAEELARGGTITRFPNAGARVARALLAHGDGAAPSLAQALEIAGRSVAAGAASDEVELVRRAIDSARGRAGDGEFSTALESLELPQELEASEAVVRAVVTPANPRAAAEWWLARLIRTLEDGSEEELDWETDEDAVAEVQGLVRELDLVSSYAPERARDTVLKLPLAPMFPSYAEGVLRLRANVAALARRIETGVLTKAVSSSKEGASLARQHALQCRSLKRDALLAALEGVVVYPLDDIAFNEATAMLDRKDDVVPRLEQLAHLAYRGARRKAERLYGGDDLLFGLLGAVEQVLDSSPEAASRLLHGVSAWRGGPKRIRRDVADRFVQLLEGVKTQVQLEVVLAGALAFFEEPKSVERVNDFRRALPDAVRRVGPLSRQSLLDVLERAGPGLRMENKGQTWFSDLVASRIP